VSEAAEAEVDRALACVDALDATLD
jgi:hypothetical protein